MNKFVCVIMFTFVMLTGVSAQTIDNNSELENLDFNHWYPKMVDDKFGFVDADGKVMIAMQYDVAWKFNPNGLAPVQIGDKQGFINAKGEVVVPVIYDQVWDFCVDNNQFAPVEKDGKQGFVDEQGKVVIPLEYDKVQEFDKTNTAEVELNGEVFKINTQNQRVD